MTQTRLRAGVRAVVVGGFIVAVALGLSLVFITASGYPASQAIESFYEGAFGGPVRLASTLSKMTPLILVALGWIVAFSARRFNVGLEGQMLIGALIATVVALSLKDAPSVVVLPLALVGGTLGGAAFAGLAAWMWARFGVSDIVSTLMLNFVAIQLVAWLVRGPLRETGGILAQSDPIPPSAEWPRIWPGTTLRLSIVLIPLAIAAVAILLSRTVLGFRIRLTGANAECAQQTGTRVKSVGALVLVISGGLAGLAGTTLVLGGDAGALSERVSGGRGFEGIAVALLAGNSPWGCLPAALLFAALESGGGLMEARVGVPSALVLITQGVVIVLATLGTLVAGVRRPRGRRERPGPVHDQLGPKWEQAS